jgi:hypothetical protein
VIADWKPLNILAILGISVGEMPKKNDGFTTLKVSKANLNRLFKLKRTSDDTYDVVITKLLNERENTSARDEE